MYIVTLADADKNIHATMCENAKELGHFLVDYDEENFCLINIRNIPASIVVENSFFRKNNGLEIGGN